MDTQPPRTDEIPQKSVTMLVSLYEARYFLKAKIENLRQLQDFSDCWVVLLNCQNKHGEDSYYSEFLRSNHNVLEIRYDHWVSLYRAWNDGIRATRSKYIMNSNVDDMLHPEYLRACTEFLDSHPDTAVVSTRVGLTRTPNQHRPDWTVDSDMPFYSFPLSTAGPCPMWRRELHHKYGLFCEQYQVISDGIMWDKWYAGGETFGLIDRRLALYYKNPRSLERRQDQEGQSLVEQEKIRRRKSAE